MSYTLAGAIGGSTEERFSYLGTDTWVWLPAVADPATGATAAEIEAGTGLHCSTNDIQGFSVSPTFTDTQDLCNIIDGKVFDGATVDNSSITFYAARDAEDAKAFFAPLQTGFILHAPYGLTEGLPADLWPVTVGTVTSVPGMRGPSVVRVDFAPASPLLGFELPEAA